MPQPIHKRKINPAPARTNRPAVSLLTNSQWQYLQRKYRITPRELQIAKLICLGLPNEEIADRLDIKTGTVKVHVRNLYRKTWVENKILMLLRFIEDSPGLIPFPHNPS